MILELAIAPPRTERDLNFETFADVGLRPPELGVPWISWREQLASSVLVLLRGPAPPKHFLGGPFFRDCWIESSFPKLAFLTAIACQVLLILFPPPIWNI